MHTHALTCTHTHARMHSNNNNNNSNIFAIVCCERHLHARTIARLKGKYTTVVRRIKFIVDEKNCKIDQLILDLCATDEDNQTIFSTDEAFVKITNTAELFLWIGKYCSMYDYELLLALVESTECREAVQLLDDFSKDLQSSILKELDLLAADGELRDIKDFIPGTHKLVIKYVGGKCTLTTMEMFRELYMSAFTLIDYFSKCTRRLCYFYL